MQRDEAVAKIRQCKTLPSLPAIAVQVLDLARRQDTSLRDIADLISNDPALAAKILRVVNSSFYGLPRQISTLSAAVVVLGLEAVKTLVLGFSLLSGLRPGDKRGEEQLAYWRHSLYSAVAAQLIARRLGEAGGEELFVAGLLHDIGSLAMRQVFGDGGSGSGGREEIGLDHAEAGQVLAEQWGLPPLLAAVVRWHHRPRSADPAMQRPCRIVRLACLSAEVFMGGVGGRGAGEEDAGTPGRRDTGTTEERPTDSVPASPSSDPRPVTPDPRYRVCRYARAAFGLGAEVCDSLLSEIGAGVGELADVFEIDLGGQGLTTSRGAPVDQQGDMGSQIMAEANEALQELVIGSQLAARQFQANSETDPLTGLANRRKFQECLESEFGRAVSGVASGPLSVVFVDLDRFKALNDSLGHAAGDEGLRHIAGLLRSLARPVDIVARYGGDEFVVLCPATPLARAVELAEGVRQKVQAIPLVINGKPWPMTVSVGVAEYNGKDRLCPTADYLLSRADKAAYEAKKGGRNSVRIFSSDVRLPHTQE